MKANSKLWDVCRIESSRAVFGSLERPRVFSTEEKKTHLPCNEAFIATGTQQIDEVALKSDVCGELNESIKKIGRLWFGTLRPSTFCIRTIRRSRPPITLKGRPCN